MVQSIGEVGFGLTAETSGLDEGLALLKKVERQVSSLANRQSEAANQTALAFLKQERAIKAALIQTENMQTALSRVGAPQALIQKNAQAFNSLAASMAGPQLSMVKFARAQDAFRAASASTGRELKLFNSETLRSTLGTGKLAAALANLEAASILAVGPLSGIGSRIRVMGAIASETGSLKLPLLIAGVVAAGLAIFKLGASSITAAREMQRIEAVFKTATGSSIAAADEFQFVAETAQKLGISLQGTARQYALFIAATENTNITGAQTRDIFLGISDAAAALQLDSEQTSGIFKAFTDIISKGTIQMEELKQQLGDRLPGAINIFATALGVSKAQLIDMAKKGQLLAEVNLPKMGIALQKAFGADALKNADTLNAAFNRLSNSSLLFFSALGANLGIADKAKTVIDGIASSLDFMRSNLDKIPTILAIVTGGIAALGAVRLHAQIMAVGGAIAFVATTARAATNALKGLAVVTALTGGFTALSGSLLTTVAGFRALIVAVGFFEAVAIVAASAGVGLAAAFSAILIPLGLIAGVVAIAVGAFHLFKKATISSANATNEFLKTNREFINGMNETGRASTDLTLKQIAETDKRISNIRNELSIQIAAFDEMARKQQEGPGFFSKLVFKDPAGSLAKDLDEAGKQALETRKRLDALINQRKELFTPVKTKVAETELITDKQSHALEDAKQSIKRIGEQMAAMRQGPKAFREMEKVFERQDKIEKFKESLERANVEQGQLNDLTFKYGQALAALEPAAREFDIVKQRMEALERVAEKTMTNIEDGILNVIDGTQTLGQVFSSVIDNMLRDLTRFFLQSFFIRPTGEGSILGDIFGSFLGSAFGGGATTSSAPTASTPTPGRARGGTVSSGRSFMVGERGPEIFAPTSAGRIIPNSAMGGATTVNVNVINKAGNTQATVQESTYGNTRNIDVMIDEVVASKIGNPSSRTNKALRNAGQGGVIRR